MPVGGGDGVAVGGITVIFLSITIVKDVTVVIAVAVVGRQL